MDEISRLPGPWFDSELDGGIFVDFFGGKGTLRVQGHFFLNRLHSEFHIQWRSWWNRQLARLAAAQSQVGHGGTGEQASCVTRVL